MTLENKEKRKLKREPKLNLDLNIEQKEVKTKFYNNDVNFILGDYGSGKTLVACAIALHHFRTKQCNKIIITRPIVKNSLGFLPGDIKEKMASWVAPIVHNFNMLQKKEVTDKMLEDATLEILPIDFAKGITYVDSVVIVDEFQDMDYSDFRTMLTRLGRDSKLMFSGSKEQIDRSVKNSCIDKVLTLKNFNKVGFSELKSNHRNPILTDIINYLEQ